MIEEIEARGLLSLFLESLFMDRSEFQRVLDNAASQRDCRVIDLMFNDDDNVFEVTLTKIQTGKRVDLQDCEYVHRAILAAFDRDVEDYELEVGSAGLGYPFKVRRQWEIHVGKPVETLLKDGRKYRGVLTEVGEESFSISAEERVRHEGEKRPRKEMVTRTFGYDECVYTKYYLK